MLDEYLNGQQLICLTIIWEDHRYFHPRWSSSLMSVRTASMLDEYLNGDAGESNPNMRDDEYLKCPPSHILFHHHYVTELTTAPHHSQMLNNHNLAFSPLQLTHNQTLQSSDLTIFFQPWQVFISTAEQNRLLLFESPAWIRLKDSIQTHLGLNVLFVCFPQIVQSPQIFINICTLWTDFHQYLSNLIRFPSRFV